MSLARSMATILGLTPEDFAVAAPAGRDEVEAWLWRPFDFRARPDTTRLPVTDGVVGYGQDVDVYKMAAIERHESFGPEPAAEVGHDQEGGRDGADDHRKTLETDRPCLAEAQPDTQENDA